MAQGKPDSAAPEITRPFAVEDGPSEAWPEGQHLGGRVRRLGPFAGSSRVGVAVEELSPGERSCPVHFTCSRRSIGLCRKPSHAAAGRKNLQLSVGDDVCFPAGHEAGRNLRDNTNALCRHLVIGERNPMMWWCIPIPAWFWFARPMSSTASPPPSSTGMARIPGSHEVKLVDRVVIIQIDGSPCSRFVRQPFRHEEWS